MLSLVLTATVNRDLLGLTDSGNLKPEVFIYLQACLQLQHYPCRVPNPALYLEERLRRKQGSVTANTPPP